MLNRLSALEDQGDRLKENRGDRAIELGEVDRRARAGPRPEQIIRPIIGLSWSSAAFTARVAGRCHDATAVSLLGSYLDVL